MEKQRRRERLGEVLTRARLAAGLSQSDVAARLGKPQSFVSKYESAERRIDLPDLEEITAALGVSLDRIVAEYRESIDAG